MKHLIALPLILAALNAHAWGPGDSGGGEPPGPNSTFEQGSQPQCLTAGDFWGQFMPELLCGYTPPIKPPTEWQPEPMPPIYVPAPPVPEPPAWMLALMGAGVLLVLRRKVAP